MIQFRNLDYGMERCALWISIPRVNATHNPATLIQPVSGAGIDIWELDVDEELFPLPSGKWSSPPRRRLLYAGGLVLKEDTGIQLEEFSCRSGQHTTFEIACAPVNHDDCLLDFWQVKGLPLNGKNREMSAPRRLAHRPCVLGLSMRQFDTVHQSYN